MKTRLLKLLSATVSFMTPIRIIVVTAVILFFRFVIMGDQGIYQLKHLLDMRNDLIAERTELGTEIDQLNKQREILSDPKKLEMVIRTELGYIKPGEIIFEEKAEAPPAPAPASAPAHAPAPAAPTPAAPAPQETQNTKTSGPVPNP